MKSVRLFILLFFIPLTFNAQKTLTGLWTGSLSNDSVTVRRDQSFEIVLTQYKQKVYGYSRATFIVNDTLYYIVKRVKGTIAGDVCEVTDDEIISFNFRGKLDKGIKVTHTFRMNNQDSTWSLSGDWTTNKTKKFYAVSGKVDLKDEPDMDKSKIIPHLEELNLAKEVPFYVETKKKEKDEELRRIAATTRKDPPPTKQTKPGNTGAAVASKTEPKKSEPVAAVEKKPTITPVENKPANTEPVAILTEKPVNNPPARQEPVASITQQQKTQQDPALNKPEQKKPELTPVRNEPVASVTPKPTTPARNEPVKSEPVAVVEKKSTIIPVENKPVVTEPKKSEPIAVTEKPAEKRNEPAAALNNDVRKITPANTQPQFVVAGAALQVNQRRTAPPQEVSFVSDSLVFALYDNGEIDGDTVSVLMNGELMLAKQGLKASAIKKTIYMDQGTDEVTLILYAENLGKYPPNTGLLVVYDGEERYQIRFSADLQQNASVVFRRKKK